MESALVNNNINIDIGHTRVNVKLRAVHTAVQGLLAVGVQLAAAQMLRQAQTAKVQGPKNWGMLQRYGCSCRAPSIPPSW
jgi:hypothetical protein